MKTLLTIFCLAITQFVQAQEYTAALAAAKMDLDSAWAQTTVPASDQICLPEQSHLLRKKQLSNHDCLEVAIKTARAQGAEAAVPWVVASQCYNPAGQDRVSKAGVDAVRYVMNTYGGGQAGIRGFNTPQVVAPEPVVTNYSFTNQTGEVTFMYTLDTDSPEATHDCKDFVYKGTLAVGRSYNTPVAKGKYLLVRFAPKQGKDGCLEAFKEFKVGPKPDQTVVMKEQLFIK